MAIEYKVPYPGPHHMGSTESCSYRGCELFNGYLGSILWLGYVPNTTALEEDVNSHRSFFIHTADLWDK